MGTTDAKSQLALLGGSPIVTSEATDMFEWPIITEEDEQAVLDVLRARKMSGSDISKKFEAEFAHWLGAEYAVTTPNGTASILEAMFAAGVGLGDEVIAPSLTFWASVLQLYSLGATVVFADIDPDTLCIDPADIEARITDHTKAILVVHYTGYPCDMDAIMAIARKRNLKVIEDVSHAQGGLYQGRMLGTIGDVGAMSMMTGKAFATGEGGILVTNDHHIYERALAFGHYIRHNDPGAITDEYLRSIRNLPLGGVKNRLNQTVSAMARVQLKHFPVRMAEIDKAMNYFWDLLADVPGLKAHRPPEGSGSSKGGWYFPLGLYRPEQLGGLSCKRFCEAIRAEGISGISPGANAPLHTHQIFNTVDIYGHGKPTRIANSDRDLRQPTGSLPVTEGISSRIFTIPWFKHYRPRYHHRICQRFRQGCPPFRRPAPRRHQQPSGGPLAPQQFVLI